MTVTIHPCVYVSDDTDYYNLGDDAKWIERIENVYLYDSGQITHCCELAGSHYLEHIYTAIDFVDSTPDEVREELHDRYGCEVLDGMYVHAGGIKPARVLNSDDYEDCEYDDAWADTVDYYRCNVPY